MMGNAISNHIYIVTDSRGTKVGIAGDLKRRLGQLNVYHERVRLERLWALGSLAKHVEFFVHKFLAKHRIYGEWYSCSVRCAVRAVNIALKLVIFGQYKSMTTAQVAKKHKLSVGTIYKHCPGGRGAALMMK